jgi:hypothetical protein
VQSWGSLTTAEKLQAFPELAGAGCCIERGLPEIFRPALERAVAKKELPAHVDLDAALVALLSTFFGVPLWMGQEEPNRIRPAYRRQLQLIWAGLRCEAR